MTAWKKLPGLVRLLIAVNAALLTVLTISTGATLVGDQLFKNAIYHQLTNQDERLDVLEALHNIPLPSHEHP